MFGRSFTIFKLAGFKINIDTSLLFLGLLITWGLGAGYFPANYPGLSSVTYWLMGGASTLGLFFSIIFHELCHSLVARSFGLKVNSITLFIFGGVSDLEKEPGTPKVEFLMAAAGPLFSIVFGFAMYGLLALGTMFDWSVAINGVVAYLAILNIILAVFNLVPAFPLDGGRIFRSILWKIKGDMLWATRIASNVGIGFGWLLIGLGILAVILGGNLIAGVWYVLIGILLKTAAKMSYEQLLIKHQSEPKDQ